MTWQRRSHGVRAKCILFTTAMFKNMRTILEKENELSKQINNSIPLPKMWYIIK